MNLTVVPFCVFCAFWWPMAKWRYCNLSMLRSKPNQSLVIRKHPFDFNLLAANDLARRAKTVARCSVLPASARISC